MIWRPSRASRMLENVALPVDLPDGIVVGALDLAALRDLEIWRRLVQTSLPGQSLSTLIITETWTPKKRRLAEATFAPSDLAAIAFLADPDRHWQSLTEGESTFAALIRAHQAVLLILGAPTDAAWDRLEEAIGKAPQGTADFSPHLDPGL